MFRIFALIAALLLFVPQTALAQATPRYDSAQGAYIQGFPANLSALDDFMATTNRTQEVVNYFQGWFSEYPDFCASCADYVRTKGGTPMVTWEPWDDSTMSTQYDLDHIINGTYDAYITQYLTAVKNYGYRVLIRPMHEMNGDWYPWGVNFSTNTPAKYKTAFRHIRNIGTAVGATNVRWVWCANINHNTSPTYSDFYPGDIYVDYMALDGYDFPEDGFIGPLNLFKSSIDKMALVSSKPMMIAETGVTDANGHKATWLTNLQNIAKTYPRIKAIVYFHKDDWKVDTTLADLNGYINYVYTMAGEIP